MTEQRLTERIAQAKEAARILVQQDSSEAALQRCWAAIDAILSADRGEPVAFQRLNTDGTPDESAGSIVPAVNIWSMPSRPLYAAAPSTPPMTVIDKDDDDALRFACRVLDHGSQPPEEDRKAARDGLQAIRTRLRAPSTPQPAPEWADIIEQRLLTWRQRLMNKSGDRLALDDFMGQESIDDLVDFVCSPLATPQPDTVQVPK